MAKEEFALLEKVQDMLIYAYPILHQYPKVERFSLADDIRHCMNMILEYTISVEKRHTKTTALEKLDIENEKLKIYIRISHKLKYIDAHRYGVWSKKAVEIGKMIGGLIKSVSGKPKS
jgi:four helix bundle protein